MIHAHSMQIHIWSQPSQLVKSLSMAFFSLIVLIYVFVKHSDVSPVSLLPVPPLDLVHQDAAALSVFVAIAEQPNTNVWAK